MPSFGLPAGWRPASKLIRKGSSNTADGGALPGCAKAVAPAGGQWPLPSASRPSRPTHSRSGRGEGGASQRVHGRVSGSTCPQQPRRSENNSGFDGTAGRARCEAPEGACSELQKRAESQERGAASGAMIPRLDAESARLCILQASLQPSTRAGALLLYPHCSLAYSTYIVTV